MPAPDGRCRSLRREALRRLPDYVIDEARFRPYPANGVMTGVAMMPVTFTKGAREGDGRRPF